jgi:hypothetical protein
MHESGAEQPSDEGREEGQSQSPHHTRGAEDIRRMDELAGACRSGNATLVRPKTGASIRLRWAGTSRVVELFWEVDLVVECLLFLHGYPCILCTSTRALLSTVPRFYANCICIRGGQHTVTDLKRPKQSPQSPRRTKVPRTPSTTPRFMR